MIAAFNFFHATAAGAPTPYALQFASASSQYATADDTGLPTTGNFSVAFWFKTASTGGVLEWGTWPDHRFGIVVYHGSMSVWSSGAGSYWPSGDTNAQDDAWHFAVITWDGAVIGVSIDGGSLYTGITWVTPDITLGDGLRVGVVEDFTYFDGKIDDVRIWGSALSNGDITTLYNSGNGLTTALGGELRWYKFSENTGTTTADSGSQNKTLTFVTSYEPTWTTGKV